MVVEGSYIIADLGKVLYCTFDGVMYGREVILGYVYYAKGEPLQEAHLLTAEEFIEIEDPLIAEMKAKYDGKTPSYAEVKSDVVKVRYSYDDQIALMINYQDDPEKYRKAYEEMQQWRNIASYIAKEITNIK